MSSGNPIKSNLQLLLKLTCNRSDIMTQELPTAQSTLHSTAQPIVAPTPHCSVKWIEVVALSLGAVGLIGAAIVGLGHKLMTNMHDAKRVEKIARHIVYYQFPQASYGTNGLSIGAESFAVLSDRPVDPHLRLFAQKSPIDPIDRTAEFVREMGLAAAWSGSWEEGTQEKTEPLTYCSHETELEIRKGNWLEAGRDNSVPAIEYTLSAKIKQHDQTIRILATGIGAEKQAKSLLRSIQCRG
jgi:hypothetical protein